MVFVCGVKHQNTTMRVVWLILFWVHISIIIYHCTAWSDIAKIYIGWCTICTSERELILKTYIVMPTSTGVPEMWHTRPRFSSKNVYHSSFCNMYLWIYGGPLAWLAKKCVRRSRQKILCGILVLRARAPFVYFFLEESRGAQKCSPFALIKFASLCGEMCASEWARRISEAMTSHSQIHVCTHSLKYTVREWVFFVCVCFSGGCERSVKYSPLCKFYANTRRLHFVAGLYPTHIVLFCHFER